MLAGTSWSDFGIQKKVCSLHSLKTSARSWCLMKSPSPHFARKAQCLVPGDTDIVSLKFVQTIIFVLFFIREKRTENMFRQNILVMEGVDFQSTMMALISVVLCFFSVTVRLFANDACEFVLCVFLEMS